MDFNDIQKAAELISNGLAVPVLLLSFLVVFIWFKPALKSFRLFSPRNAEQWFIIGVFLGFFGEFFDNLYWTISWVFSYLESNYSLELIKFGVFPNIFFRQTLAIAAAYCHVRSFLQYKNNHSFDSSIDCLLILSIILGFLFAVSLVFTKSILI